MFTSMTIPVLASKFLGKIQDAFKSKTTCRKVRISIVPA